MLAPSLRYSSRGTLTWGQLAGRTRTTLPGRMPSMMRSVSKRIWMPLLPRGTSPVALVTSRMVPLGGHVRGAVVRRRCASRCSRPHSSCAWTAFLEIGVERGVHAAEQGRGHGGAAELAILDGIDPGGHPAAADEGLVRLGLIAGRRAASRRRPARCPRCESG